jgi:hypothetical protein
MNNIAPIKKSPVVLYLERKRSEVSRELDSFRRYAATHEAELADIDDALREARGG